MQLLKERIKLEGQNLGRGILKVDSFLNHQVDSPLILAIGGAMAAYFRAFAADINKVLTAEISGIAPALATGLALGVPIVYARKNKPITMPEDIYLASAPSRTKGVQVDLMVSPEFLGLDDKVLIIDDFLASGQTIMALVELTQLAQAQIAGIGVVIEKSFEEGRARLRDQLTDQNIPIHALATIKAMTESEIIFVEGDSA